ncbi:MAG TPA: flavin reductase family protein [Longimicrobiales bacterium]|nr:flavin reductase family protein [Longimicrobiales bacterium]
MSFEAAEFRRILGHMATGVAVVAATDPDRAGPSGLTANAIAAVSLDPPLVLACVDRAAETHDCILRADAFAISILGAEDEAIARRFAEYPSDRKFVGVAYGSEATGAPILEEAMAWVDCRVWATYDGGDHTIFVGEVLAGDAADESPLLFFRGGFDRLAR